LINQRRPARTISDLTLILLDIPFGQLLTRWQQEEVSLSWQTPSHHFLKLFWL
jgi:hypothetical protein